VFLAFIFWCIRGVLPIWNFVCLDSLSALRPSQCGKQDGKHLFTSLVHTLFLIKNSAGNTHSNTGNTHSNTGNTHSNTGNTHSNTGNTQLNTGNTQHNHFTKFSRVFHQHCYWTAKKINLACFEKTITAHVNTFYVTLFCKQSALAKPPNSDFAVNKAPQKHKQ
jgi:hypothetical protein